MNIAFTCLVFALGGVTVGLLLGLIAFQRCKYIVLKSQTKIVD